MIPVGKELVRDGKAPSPEESLGTCSHRVTCLVSASGKSSSAGTTAQWDVRQ